MHDCCSCSGTDSFISVIDHLPSASFPLSLHFSLNFHTPSPSSKQKKKKVTRSFLQPVRLRLSFLHHSPLHRSLLFIKCPRRSQTSHTLAANADVTAGGKCTVSWSGRPSTVAVAPMGGRSELLTVEGGEGEGKKNRITSFTIPTWERESKHPSAWWRRVTVGFDQSHNSSSITPVTNKSFQFMSYIWSHNQRKFIMHGNNYAWK